MSVSFDFTGRQVWVIGARSGIGREAAAEFVKSGATVTGFDSSFSGDEEFKSVQSDITDADRVKKVFEDLLTKISKLDVLVNAAGVLQLGATDVSAEESWKKCFDVNATGAFNLLRTVMPIFKRQKSGSIVVVASNSAHAPRIGMSAYGASKSALVSFTRSVGSELAEFGVRCNIVSPGSTDTDMLRGMLGSNYQAGVQKLVDGLPEQYKLGVPLKKIAKPSEIATTVLFLASDASSHTILQDIVIDGGATLGA